MKPSYVARYHSRKPALPAWQILILIASILLGYHIAVFAMGRNFREVVPQRVYRSGQPDPDQLRAWIRRYKFKTIVNLRGPNSPLAAEEEAIAAATGVDIVYIELSAFRLVPSDQLKHVIEVLETAKQPILFHCNHGVDRSGTISAIAAWLLGGQPYRRAKWQAYVPPGPWKHRNGSSHISDLFDVYEDYCRARELDCGDPACFRYWAENVYNPQRYLAGPRAGREVGAERMPSSAALGGVGDRSARANSR